MPDSITKAKSRYRPEIDGLRAFAVIAVIINHFNKDLLPSGYLGVDIFFVISGYVITSSLAGRESKNFWDFLSGFYERRIKRLVPALVVFVLITSILICLFNPVPGVALGLGWRSLFGISNITLYRSATDYFAESTELNPFTHTWSLGVEEQFYLLFPFLIWFSGFGRQAAKGARNLFLWIGALTIASLSSFIYLYQVNQPAAYFLMPPRFWEMAAGCLLFIGFQRRAKIEKTLERVPPLLVVAAMVGVMFLPISAAVPATVGIVVLSAVLIACLKQGTAAYTFFTFEKFVYIGLISYSLYLWHWTVLSISRWTIGIHWWSAPFQVGVMLLLAIFSHKWVETPIRKQHLGKRFKSILGGLILLSLSMVALRGLRKFSEPLYLGNLNNYYLSENGAKYVPLESVKDENLKRKTLIALGNSHAANIVPLLRDVATKNSLDYKVLNARGKPIPSINGRWIRIGATEKVSRKMGNPDLERTVDAKDARRISDIDAEAIRAVGELGEGDILILSSRHYPMYKELFVHNGEKFYQTLLSDDNLPLDRNKLAVAWKSKLSRLINKASQKGASIVFFTPFPEFQSELAPPALCVKEWFRPQVAKNCQLKEAVNPMLWDRFIPEMDSILKELEHENEKFYVFKTFHLLCPTEKVTCSTSNEYGRIFSDNDHLSTSGALLLSGPFENFLQKNMLLDG